jgi:hypothetical protein
MIRQIIIPTQKSFTIELPEDFIGNEVELTLEKKDSKLNPQTNLEKVKRKKALEASLQDFRIDLSNFKFNRDEANDYE